MLQRAVPPPIGDIAISNLDPSATVINLATNQRVPRLVLKDAPVQDVLALLARAAGLNVAFFEAPPTEGAANAAAPQLKISLDIEDESVQDVFNNVLRLTGLQASRQGTTIVVGANLPDTARNTISRTLRLNQLGLLPARDFLISQGAESNEVQTREQIQTTAIEGSSVPIVSRNVQTQVELITADAEDEPYQGRAPLPLRGLLVSIARRGGGELDVGNEITLVGEPRQVELATAMLSQLETRRPQVAVNVKIVDVNLLNDERFRSSFSFGIGDTFVVSDGGSGVINFGGAQPPNSATFNSSPITAPVIPNPYQGDPFFDISNPINIPGTVPGITTVGPNGSITNTPNSSGQFGSPVSGVSEDPFQGGITGVTPATPSVVTQAADGTITTTLGQVGSVEFSLPSLFQYPTRFLSTLRAEVVSGNAKILTDPTLVVQEGETAIVNLTNDVVKRVTVDFTETNAGERETRTVEFEQVGLLLSLQVQRIDDNGFVTLRAEPTVSSPSGQIDIGDDQFVTTVQRRTVSSGRIRVRDGQTLILSGIIQDSDRTSVTKWPILGDLPIIGALFRNTNTTNQRSEVIVLLTPNIIQDTDAATFGYGYTPGPEAREVLQQGNFSDPTRPR
jgi:type IV pilus assembly protein PilQ